MRKLAIAAAVSMGLATFSANSFALGLGEIEMYSALNQSLDAEINIIAATPEEIEGLVVRLAPSSAYERAGIEQPPILSSLVFDVERRPAGDPVVRISSTVPVLEPFLNFLIEIESTQGSVLTREYTVLLDQPVLTATTPVSSDIPSELVISDAEEAGSVVDLSSEIETTRQSLDLSEAESEIVNLDSISNGGVVIAESTLSFESDVEPSEVIEPEVFIKQDSIDSVQTYVAGDFGSNAAGELIALAPDETVPLAELPLAEFVTDDELSGGEVVSLDSLVGAGGPIFSVEADTAGNQITQLPAIVSGGGTAVNLSSARSSSSLSETGVIEIDEGVVVNLDELSPREFVQTDQLPLAQTFGVVADSTPIDLLVAQSEDATPLDLGSLNFGVEIDLSGELFEPAQSAPEGSQSAPVPSATSQSFIDQAGEGIVVDLSESGPGAIPSVSEYIVGLQDTLWSIARNNKLSGVSTQQMMVALLELNETAFVDGDMNQMRNGAVLTLPSAESFTDVSVSEALAIVRKQVDGSGTAIGADAGSSVTAETPTIESQNDSSAKPLRIVGVDQDATSSGTPTTDERTSGADLTRNLEEVNRRMQLAQEELASESMQRDELRGRVNELEDSMSKMKTLITLRESELSNLQDELDSAKTDTSEAAAEAENKARMLAEAQIEKDAMQVRLSELQEKITANASNAQSRVDQQADADKNLASAEAQAQSVRLATEEDTIRAQLAALREEKKLLEQTAQDDKMELVRQAEAEKAELLAQAKAERERIMSELEDEKRRITAEASAERGRIAVEAQLEKESLIAEADAERAKLAAESNAIRIQLADLEEEKTRLLAEAEAEKTRLLAEAEADKTELQEVVDEAKKVASEAQKVASEAQKVAAEQEQLQTEAMAEKTRVEEESNRVKDRLAQLQAEASANLTASTENTDIVVAQVDDTVSKAMEVSPALETGATDNMATSLASKGAAAASGLLAIAPLQEAVGDRKTVLATGGGIALLGLLGAWAMRRRKGVKKEGIDLDRAESRAVSRSIDDDEIPNVYDNPPAIDPMTRTAATVAAGGVAAGGVAAAAATAVKKTASNDPVGVETYDRPQDVAARPSLSDAEPLEDGMLLDDTITEAEVYLRYGLHGQAEDLLKTAIERSPDNEEYHVKLLENYHDQKNEDGFKDAAAAFQDRFGNTENWPRIAEMGRELDSGDQTFSREAALDSARAVSADVPSASGGIGAALESIHGRAADTKSNVSEQLEETLDPGSEFSVAELEATGDFTQGLDDIDDLGDVTLDEVDLAALDDDGTLNLEELAGDEMSGLDLGALDLTNPDSDSTLDNLTLDDADLNSLGDVTSNVRSGLESDLSVDDFADGIDNTNEMETMLDLAKAYIDMGDNDSASSALRDIAENGNAAQQMEANDLLRGLT